MSEDSEIELREYLELAAAKAEVSVTDLLRRILHLNSSSKESRFLKFFTNMDEPTRSLLTSLDYRLKVLNPGLHYVYRTAYVGYRREGIGPGAGPGAGIGQRSQIFVCILRRNHILQVVMPLDPHEYKKVPGCRSLEGTGHHGVGDLLVDIADAGDLELFFSTFDSWLHSPAGFWALFLLDGQGRRIMEYADPDRIAAEIRRSIEDSVERYRQVNFFDLRNQFGIRLWSAARKKMVSESLAHHGVMCEPPLTELSLNDLVTLTLRDSAPPDS